RDRVGVEGVGLDDVGACGEVGAVDAGDHLRPRQRQDVVVAAEVPAVSAEALAAKAALIEPLLLDHGAHRAIEQHDALAEEALEALDARRSRGLVHRLEREGHCEGALGARTRARPGLAVGARRDLRRLRAVRAVRAVRGLPTAAQARASWSPALAERA